MFNQATLIGNLGQDPEVSDHASGKVAKLSVATHRRWTDKNGERQERTEWHNVTAFGKLAEIVGEHHRKGAQVFVQGRLETSSWETEAGEKRYRTEIIANQVLTVGSSGAKGQKSADAGAQEGQAAAQAASAAAQDASGDVPWE